MTKFLAAGVLTLFLFASAPRSALANKTMWNLCRGALVQFKQQSRLEGASPAEVTQLPEALKVAKAMGFGGMDERAWALAVFDAYLAQFKQQHGANPKELAQIISSGLPDFDFDNQEFAMANIERHRAQFAPFDWDKFKESLFDGYEMYVHVRNVISPVQRWSVRSMFLRVASRLTSVQSPENLDAAWAQYQANHAGPDVVWNVSHPSQNVDLIFLPESSPNKVSIVGRATLNINEDPNPAAILTAHNPSGQYQIESIQVDRIVAHNGDRSGDRNDDGAGTRELEVWFRGTLKLEASGSVRSTDITLSDSTVHQYLNVLNGNDVSVPPSIQTMAGQQRWLRSRILAAVYALRFLSPNAPRAVRNEVGQALNNSANRAHGIELRYARETLGRIF